MTHAVSGYPKCATCRWVVDALNPDQGMVLACGLIGDTLENESALTRAFVVGYNGGRSGELLVSFGCVMRDA